MSEKIPSPKPEQEQPIEQARDEKENRSLGRKILGLFGSRRKKQRSESVDPENILSPEPESNETEYISDEPNEAVAPEENTSVNESEDNPAKSVLYKCSEEYQRSLREKYTYPDEKEIAAAKTLLDNYNEEYRQLRAEIAQKGESVTPEDKVRLDEAKERVSRSQIDYVGHFLPRQAAHDYTECFYHHNGSFLELDKRKEFIIPFLVQAAHGTFDRKDYQATLEKEELTEEEREEIRKSIEPIMELLMERNSYCDEDEIDFAKSELNDSFEKYQHTLQEISQKGESVTPEDKARLDKAKEKVSRSQIDYIGRFLPVQAFDEYIKCFYSHNGSHLKLDKHKEFIIPFLLKATKGTFDQEELQKALEKEDTSDGLTKEEREEIWRSIEPFVKLILERKK